MSEQRPYCLSIAGFDPCGGAGVLADIKTFEQFKVSGLSAISCITYQNDSDFKGVTWLTDEEIIKQLSPLTIYPVNAVKIGLVKDIKSLGTIIEWIKNEYPKAWIIWDPVLKSTAGFLLHEKLELPEKVLKKVDLVTPNYPEYKALKRDIFLAKNVLIKGGHSQDNPGTDILVRAGIGTRITGEVFKNKSDKHGTGCVLSSAITAGLANGLLLDEACKQGKKYVEGLIQSNAGKLGYHTK